MLANVCRLRLSSQFVMKTCRGFATRYSYNKTIPQTIYAKENIVLSFTDEQNKKESKNKKRSPMTKLGLSSGKALPSSQFYTRCVSFDEEQNINKDELTRFDKPFYSLIRDDLWVLDPLSMTDAQIPDSLNLLPCEKSIFDVVAPGSKIVRLGEAACVGVGNACKITANIVTNPKEAKRTLSSSLSSLKSGASHVWTSVKLYGHELHSGSRLFWKYITGGQLSYREKMQLNRAVSDTSRLVPFTIFAIIPFSEFALPFVIKKFPNFLPSTFTSEAKKAEIRKDLVEARLAMAREYYDKMKDNARRQRRKDLSDAECSSAMLQQIRAVSYGQVSDVDDVIVVSKFFSDEIIVDYLDKAQLTSIAKYMNVLTLGGDELTRVALRTKVRRIVKEDRQLYFEGVAGLTRNELVQCCEERGMVCDGLLKNEVVDKMNDWLQLAVQKRVPTSLLLMSSMLSALSKEDSLEDMLPSAISMLSEDVVKETIIALAPVNDRLAMKMRYERAVKEDEEISEENLVKKEFALNPNMVMFNPMQKEKKPKKAAKHKKKTGTIE
ncbi:hypothetical protein WA577_006637, partial [Blastocystis sp. JDR]